MEISRRGLLGGLVAMLAAPTIVRVENLMVLPAPQKVIVPSLGEFIHIRLPNNFSVQETAVDFAVNNNLMTINQITREAVRLWTNSNAFIRNIDQQFAQDFGFMTGEQWDDSIPQLSFSEWAREKEAKVLLAGLPEGQRATNSSE